MSMLGNFLHPKRAYDQAADEYRNAQSQAQGYQQPFMDYGRQQGGNLSGAINNLLNPKEFQDKLMGDYETSPYAQAAMDASNERGQQLAQQMGMSGSTNALQSMMSQSGNIASQDKQQYLKNLMGMYNQGTGLAQGMYNTGANMGNNMANNALQGGQYLGGLGLQGQNANNQMIGAGLGFLGDMAGNYFTGGMGTGGFGSGMFTPEYF